MRKVTLTAALLLVAFLFAISAAAHGIPTGFDVFAEFGPSRHYGNVHSSDGFLGGQDMTHLKNTLFFGLVLPAFAAMAVSPLRAASSDWNSLKTLKPGMLIRVDLKDAKSFDGELQELNDQGITLRLPPSARTFARDDILRVHFKTESHRGRNLLIGAGIGVVLSALVVQANHWGENTGIKSIGWVWPVGVGTFGGIGAAIPTGGWREVYRARRGRESESNGN